MKNKIIAIVNKAMNVAVVVLIIAILLALITKNYIPYYCEVWQAWLGMCN